MDEDDTAQRGQVAAGAMDVNWSHTVACSMVTWVRRTAPLDGRKAVMRVSRL
jgi:hypothetical protein